MKFENIPNEMRAFNQWVVWRYEDTDSPKPTKVPYSPITNRHADVTDPQTWAGYDQAIAALNTGWYAGIGFVLTNEDPYAFIDLDDTKGDKPSFDRQLKVFQEFDSYAERSPSGSGLHIIVKGKVSCGRRRSFIEVYSAQRYMTMTGDVYRDAPIKDHNELLQILHEQMSEGKNAAVFYAGLEQAKLSDERVLELAASAANAEKFNDLFEGNWQKHYSSQSEADFALVDILAFYSENRAQVHKLFLQSKLGQRDKAKRFDYMNYMLNRCFDRMLAPVDTDSLRNKLNEAIEAKRLNGVESERPMLSSEAARPLGSGKYVAPTTPPSLKPKQSIYSVPPGLVGQIAQFIYAQAPRPVAEISLAGAIGLVAGIAGRSYNISGTGLNQYVLLLAPTGTGKEAIASGINKIMAEVIRGPVPAAMDFLGPSKINSEQALLKYLSNSSKSFISVVGEFGIRIKEMSSPNASPHMANLLALLLDLFNKSGEGQVLRPSIYSDKEKNTSAIESPAVSFLGESTPEKFYENLDESMIASGMLPRFAMIEYNGERPELNEQHAAAKPSFQLIDSLAQLCAISLQLNSQHKIVHVALDQNAKGLFDSFNRYCDSNINSSEREVKRHLWNRGHIKALKLAALISVGCNPYYPEVNSEIATWAINLVVADIRNLLGKFDAGEIGIENDETKQLTTLVAYIKGYVISPYSEIEKYVPGVANLHSERIIPYTFLHRKLASVAVFRKDRAGATNAIKRAIKTLIERGDLSEVGRAEMATKHKTSAVAYMIANPKVFGL